jgi:glutathione S-transferase
MTEITLYFAPYTCARVPMVALEEARHPFKAELVAFMKGDHRTPEYRALNPKGKVPVVIVDGKPLTENVAILMWLATRFPEATLLPKDADPFGQAEIISDLAFCASTLHPLVTRLRIPQYFCDLPAAAERVFALAEAAMRPSFALIDQRLSNHEWWYGELWSIMDVYLNWVWFRVAGTVFDVSPFPHFARHAAAIVARPSVKRALDREAEAASWLAKRGLEVKFTRRGGIKAANS